MIFLAYIIVSISSISTTDCFSTSSSFWNLQGSYVIDQTDINFESNDATQSFLEYTSKRHRKKWMVSLCGNFEDSFLNFSSSSDNFSIEIEKPTVSLDHFDVKLRKNENILDESKMKYSNKKETCIKVIHGRGYLGMFEVKNRQKMEGDQIFTSEIEIPRKHVFRYFSKKPSNITQICIGDFFGDKRISVNSVNNDQWDQHIRDFL